MDALTYDQLQAQQKQLDRMKKTIQNHTAKIDDLLSTVNAMQTVMDGWRRKGLRFEAKTIQEDLKTGEETNGVQ